MYNTCMYTYDICLQLYTYTFTCHACILRGSPCFWNPAQVEIYTNLTYRKKWKHLPSFSSDFWTIESIMYHVLREKYITYPYRLGRGKSSATPKWRLVRDVGFQYNCFFVCQLAAVFFFHVARCRVFLHVGPWFWAPNIMVYALQCERCVACAWRWVGQALEELGGVLSGWMIRWTVQEHIKSTEEPWWIHEFHLK